MCSGIRHTTVGGTTSIQYDAETIASNPSHRRSELEFGGRCFLRKIRKAQQVRDRVRLFLIWANSLRRSYDGFRASARLEAYNDIHFRPSLHPARPSPRFCFAPASLDEAPGPISTSTSRLRLDEELVLKPHPTKATCEREHSRRIANAEREGSQGQVGSARE